MEDKERYKTGERAIAPIVATVIPALIVTVLMVVTAISSKPREKILVDIASADQDVDPIDSIDDPPEPPTEDLPPPETDVQISVDVPAPLSVAEVVAPQPVEPTAAPTDRSSCCRTCSASPSSSSLDTCVSMALSAKTSATPLSSTSPM